MTEKRFQILVFLPEVPPRPPLKFYVSHYRDSEGRIIFKDEKSGFVKDYPKTWCSIEEIHTRGN